MKGAVKFVELAHIGRVEKQVTQMQVNEKNEA